MRRPPNYPDFRHRSEIEVRIAKRLGWGLQENLRIMATDRVRKYASAVAEDASAVSGTDISESVVRVLERVPRHLLVERFYFVPLEEFFKGAPFEEYTVDPSNEQILDIIYRDEALVTRLDAEGRPTSSTSQPSLVAGMLELLDVKPGMRVLEIGAGTGYNAALLAELAEDPALVTTIDIQPDVVAQTRQLLEAAGYGEIDVLCRDGALGAPENGPYDRIVATVGCPDISWRWVEQLSPGGAMLIPLQHGGPTADPLVRLRPVSSSRAVGQVVAWSGFMPLQGELAASTWTAELPEEASPPDASFDLPPALEENRRTWDSYKTGRRTWWDFAYFLAMEDYRTYFGQVLALVDMNDDRVVLDEEGVKLWGDQSIYEDLLASYSRWEALDRPRLSDWELEFVPRTEPEPEHDPAKGVWVLARRTSWQILRSAAD